VLGGVAVNMRITPNLEVNQRRLHKLFDKTKRKNMTPDQLSDYLDKVAKPVIPRKCLPKVPPSDPEGHDLLLTLANNQQSMETLRQHLEVLDCLDGTEIVAPLDCLRSPDLGPEKLNLFDHYANITKDQVILSLKYLETWVDEPYV